MSSPSRVQPSLDGVRGKIDRAKDHLAHLKRVVVERPPTVGGCTERLDHQAQERVLEFRLQKPPEVPLLARLLIGDVVHSLAASLDYLIYQLSLSHQVALGTSDALDVCAAHKTHFPIFDSDKDNAEGRINKRLKLMAQEPADVIRSMQPYKRAQADPTLNVVEDPLWILFELDVIDKHRMVLITEEHVAPNKLTVSSPEEGTDVIPIEERMWHAAEDGAKVLEVTLGINEVPKPNVNFHLGLTSNVKFAETGLWCDGKSVDVLLGKLIMFVEKGVIGRLERFVV